MLGGKSGGTSSGGLAESRRFWIPKRPGLDRSSNPEIPDYLIDERPGGHPDEAVTP